MIIQYVVMEMKRELYEYKWKKNLIELAKT